MRDQLNNLLTQLYDEPTAVELGGKVEARLARVPRRKGRGVAWSPSDVVLITYADSIHGAGEAPLCSLRKFLKDRLDGVISHVHLLPFFPFTSDDGFAVSDYRAVDATHGTWENVRELSEDFQLIFDLVINHASASHARFREFLADEEPGNGYFMTADEGEDVSQVTRPRASPLLQRYETARGPRWVWCSFSRDQVDWDFSNPGVLFEFIDIFLSYIEYGASWMRLDAIAFLWKELGTSCIHRPQTHAVVKLLRLLAQEVSSDIKLLTETNVPLAENLSYFGDGDEAHIVYNFSLPPLLVHGLLTGTSKFLTDWCQSLPALPAGCTYLNFTASHDGIGLRPAEGILDGDEMKRFLECVQAFGGRVTLRKRPDGSLSPYEGNISLFDALSGTVDGKDNWQVARFILSQCLMASLTGVPAFYYNSILAAPNNVAGYEETGHNRTLNRRKWTVRELEERLESVDEPPGAVLEGLKEMLSIRTRQPAFQPETLQVCLNVGPEAFVLKRISEEQTLLCIFNVSAREIEGSSSLLQVDSSVRLRRLYERGEIVFKQDKWRCSPYAVGWFELESVDVEGSLVSV